MVYTVSLSPALDYVMQLDCLTVGQIQQSVRESFYPGGKGINVSNVLTQLGVPNISLGFIAGFAGDEIERLTNNLNIKTDFIRLPTGNSRVNVKLRTLESKNSETDVNTLGCEIDNGSFDKLFQKLDRIVGGDFVVLAGSVPKSVPDDIYSSILSMLSDRGIICAVDTSDSLLRNTLKHRPFLIKPNLEELGELFDVTVQTDDEIIRLALALQDEGAKNVLVSKGADGAVLLAETGELIKLPAAKGTTVNTVGAGDSMTAGFIAGWIACRDYRQALILGSACGAATAFCTGIAAKKDIDDVLANYSQTVVEI